MRTDRATREPVAERLPAGTVTFLMTDVEASSTGWDGDGRAMDEAMRDLEERTASAVTRNGGAVIKSRGEGDSAFAVFDRASAAVVAAYELQLALSDSSAVRVRCAVHTGEALLRDGDYFGVAPNRTARLRSLAHGGQIVVSRLAAELAEGGLPEEMTLVPLGTYRVRDWPQPQELFGVRGPRIRTDFPPLRIWGEKDRAVMTIVTVDMVAASELAVGFSPTELAGLFRAFARGLAETFARNNGCYMNLADDGCVALFEDPAAALTFARTVAAWAAPTLITVHAGVVELAGDDVVAKCLREAVHLRGSTRPREIAMSRTAADLLSASGLGFERRSSDASGEVYVLSRQL